MRFTLGITTKYIDRHPAASMTNNPLMGILSENPSSIKQSDNINKTNVLGHKNVVFSLVATSHLQP
jgi:hypothetical protein